MNLIVTKIWPDEVVEFRDEEGQEIRVLPIRRQRGEGSMVAAVSIGNGLSEGCEYFQKRDDGVWFKQDKWNTWIEILEKPGSHLYSWLDGILNQWMNAIMMS